MNWYKLYKIALPVLEDESGTSAIKNYMDIGHHRWENEESEVEGIVWFVDKDFNLQTLPESQSTGNFGHQGWADFNEASSKGNLVASGRYDPKTHEASCTFKFRFSSDPKIYMKKDYIRKKVESLLDREFNNPTIYLT